MFEGYVDYMSLTEIKGIENFNTSNVTDMTGMFYNCSSLTEIKVGTGWTTEHNPITDGMYTNCPVRPSI